jgi:hypothetical protein
MLGSKQCTLTSLQSMWTVLSGSPGIIVRDEAARRELKEDIGSVGIILYVEPSPTLHFLLKVTSLRTLVNSKGLEYDDVGFICFPDSLKCASTCLSDHSFTRTGHTVQFLRGVCGRTSLATSDKCRLSFT